MCSSSWCSTSSSVNIVPSFFRSSTELSGFRSNGYKRASFSRPRNERLTSSSWCHHEAQASLFNTLTKRTSFSHEYNKYISHQPGVKNLSSFLSFLFCFRGKIDSAYHKTIFCWWIAENLKAGNDCLASDHNWSTLSLILRWSGDKV